ncbi:MAG: mechanosensitive ion channel, partial [Planctomycetota bacterium]|nr:mechanosensitive ion channel [Planctomycetota bacterium]
RPGGGLPRLRRAARGPADADPQRVEDVMLEEMAAAVKTVPGLLSEPAPVVRFIPGFGEYSLDFTIVCRVREFVDQYPVQHEVRKRIFARFRKEGIEIPFPVRTVYMKQNAEGDVKVEVPGKKNEHVMERKADDVPGRKD